MLNHAKSFKKQMLTAKHALEDGHSYSDVASPPLMASVGGTRGAGLEPGSLGSGRRRPRRSPRRWSSSRRCATRAPSRAAEYEAKKQELLGRL